MRQDTGSIKRVYFFLSIISSIILMLMGPLIILLSSYFSGSPTLSRVSETEEIPAECQTRLVSTGDVETVCERDNQEEFATIDEENAEDVKEAKSSG